MKTLARPRDTAEILTRLKHIRPDSARRWGRMTAHQMICHLADSFRMALGQKPVSDASGVLQRTIVKLMALYAPLTWRSGILTRPEIDQECGGTRPGEFSSDVRDLEALVELFTIQAESAGGRVHPVFGTMSRAAWLRWAYLHTDHHLRQFGA